jgi:hypothetical protein
VGVAVGVFVLVAVGTGVLVALGVAVGVSVTGVYVPTQATNPDTGTAAP